MQVAEVKTSSSASPNIQAKRQPFFNKEGQGGFFSKSNEATEAFFSPTTIQPKPASPAGRLTIGQPNDKYEVEADATADKVVKKLGNPESDTPPSLNGGHNVVQKKCSDCEDKEKLQKKEDDEFLQNKLEIQLKPIFESNAEAPEADVQTKLISTPIIQAKCSNCEEEEKLQKKEEEFEDEMDVQAKSTDYPTEGPPDLQSNLNASKGSGSSLSSDTKSSMGSAFGADFSNVKVHTGSEAVQMNKGLGAQAFTHGNDIYFNEGKYDTNSDSGKHLLAHELTHTLQQNGIQRYIQKVNLEGEVGGNFEIDNSEMPLNMGDETNDENSVQDGTPVQETHSIDCPQLVPPYPTSGTGVAAEEQTVYDELISTAISGGFLGPLSSIVGGATDIWQLLPDTIKVRVINTVLDRAIQGAYLFRLFGRHIQGGFLASILGSMMIGFYRTLRQLPDRRKIIIFQRLGRIVVGGDLNFTLNFLKGIVMGFFIDGLVGIIQMIIDIICFIPKLINFFSTLSNFTRSIPTELKALATSLDSLMITLKVFLNNGIQEIYEIAKNPRRIGAIIELISNSINVTAEKIGEKAAESMIRFYSLPSSALGEIVGRISGQILFEAVLIYFTAGGGSALTAAKTALRFIGKILGQLGRFIFKIIGYLGRILRYVKTALQSVFRFLTRIFRLIVQKLRTVIDKILDIFRSFTNLCRPGSIICVPPHLADLLRNAMRVTRNRFYLILGDARQGWTHILERHIVGIIEGKTMFPRGMSHGAIKEMIIEAVELGTVVRRQGVRSRIRYRAGRFGVRELEVWINNSTRVIETAYPISGTGVWIFRAAPIP